MIKSRWSRSVLTCGIFRGPTLITTCESTTLVPLLKLLWSSPRRDTDVTVDRRTGGAGIRRDRQDGGPGGETTCSTSPVYVHEFWVWWYPTPPPFRDIPSVFPTGSSNQFTFPLLYLTFIYDLVSTTRILNVDPHCFFPFLLKMFSKPFFAWVRPCPVLPLSERLCYHGVSSVPDTGGTVVAGDFLWPRYRGSGLAAVLRRSGREHPSSVPSLPSSLDRVVVSVPVLCVLLSPQSKSWTLGGPSLGFVHGNS